MSADRQLVVLIATTVEVTVHSAMPSKTRHAIANGNPSVGFEIST